MVFYKIWSFISSRRRDLLMLFTALFNRETPRAIRTMIIAVFLYLISPVDFLPDIIPGLGLVDDALLVPGLLYMATQLLPPQVRAASEKRADYLVPKLPYILAVGGILLIAWTLFVLTAIYNFIFN